MSKCCWKITKDHLYGSNKTFVRPRGNHDGEEESRLGSR